MSMSQNPINHDMSKRGFDDKEEEQTTNTQKSYSIDTQHSKHMSLFTEFKGLLLGMLLFNLELGVYTDICSLGQTIYATHSKATDNEYVSLKDIWEEYLSVIRELQYCEDDPKNRLRIAIDRVKLDFDKEVNSMY